MSGYSARLLTVYGIVGGGGRSEDVVVAAQLQHVRVAAAESLDVIGVDGPAVDGGDGLFDLAGFLVGIGVDADGDVVLLRDGEGGVHDGGVAGGVFVDLEAAGSHLDVPLDGGGIGGAAASEQLDVERERLPRFEQPVEVVRGVHAEVRDVAVPHPDDGGGAGREGGGDQAGGREVDVAVHDAGRGDQPFAHDPAGVGARDDGDIV
jgi:hypothetical protein